MPLLLGLRALLGAPCLAVMMLLFCSTPMCTAVSLRSRLLKSSESNLQSTELHSLATVHKPKGDAKDGKESKQSTPTSAQTEVIMNNLRTMFGLGDDAPLTEILSKLAVTAESTAAQNKPPAPDDIENEKDKINADVPGIDGEVYDLTTVENVESSLKRMAKAAYATAAALRNQANDAVTAEKWEDAEKIQLTYRKLEDQAQALTNRAACSSTSVLTLGKGDPCALPNLQQFARQQLEAVVVADKAKSSPDAVSADVSFRGLKKIFEAKMKLAVTKAGRSLSDDRRVLQVLNIVRLLDKLVELEAKLKVAQAAQEFSRGRMLQAYFDSSKTDLTKVRSSSCICDVMLPALLHRARMTNGVLACAFILGTFHIL